MLLLSIESVTFVVAACLESKGTISVLLFTAFHRWSSRCCWKVIIWSLLLEGDSNDVIVAPSAIHRNNNSIVIYGLLLFGIQEITKMVLVFGLNSHGRMPFLMK